MHYILFYEYVGDIVERRSAYRGAHLKAIKDAFDAGEMVIGGALTDPLDGAALVFRGESREPAERFAKNDPYVVNGLVKNWKIRNWQTVVGDGAVMP